MPRMEEVFTCEGKILAGTAKAILFEIAGEECWIPYSQLEGAEDYFEGETLRKGANVEVTMTAWIAKQKGLI